jgi:hypothetical protein
MLISPLEIKPQKIELYGFTWLTDLPELVHPWKNAFMQPAMIARLQEAEHDHSCVQEWRYIY